MELDNKVLRNIVSINQKLGCLRKTPKSSSEFYGDSRVLHHDDFL